MRRRGRPPYPGLLTPREQQVLALLREGCSNQQIAERLGISLKGVEYHVSEILARTGVESRRDAARLAVPVRRWWSLAPVMALAAAPLKLRHPLAALGAAGLLAGAAVLLGFALLVWRTNGSGHAGQAPSATEGTPSVSVTGPDVVYRGDTATFRFEIRDAGAGQQVQLTWASCVPTVASGSGPAVCLPTSGTPYPAGLQDTSGADYVSSTLLSGRGTISSEPPPDATAVTWTVEGQATLELVLRVHPATDTPKIRVGFAGGPSRDDVVSDVESQCSRPLDRGETAVTVSVPAAHATVRIPELNLSADVYGCAPFRHIVLPRDPMLVSFEFDFGSDQLQPTTWRNYLVLHEGSGAIFTPQFHPGVQPEVVDPCPGLLANPQQQSAAEQQQATLCAELAAP